MEYNKNKKNFRKLLAEFYNESEEDAKVRLICCLYLALPKDDNPLLWKLLVECFSFAERILADPSNAMLEGMFADRKSPLASRLFYALTRKEDAALEHCTQKLAQLMPKSTVSCLIYDGFIIHLDDESTKSDLETHLRAISEESGVKWICK